MFWEDAMDMEVVNSRQGCQLSRESQDARVVLRERCELLRQYPLTLWFTGLSGAGKSTLAFAVERALISGGYAVYVLDGDHVRHGLSCDLSFSARHRSENVRRVAEVAKLMNDAGLIVIASLISPLRADRDVARGIIGDGRFLEAHLSTSLSVCEQRDVKGLYRRARAGEMVGFTGIDAPYEEPDVPAIRIDTGVTSIENAVFEIMGMVEPQLRY